MLNKIQALAYFLNSLLVNLALGKPSFLSGDYNFHNRKDILANSGNDGDLLTVAVSDYVYKPFWYVNLNSSIKIRLIRLHLSGYAKRKNYYQGLAVQTRIENSPWYLCRTIGTPEELILAVKCEQETTADSVRVVIDATTLVHLYLEEVEVY